MRSARCRGRPQAGQERAQAPHAAEVVHGDHPLDRARGRCRGSCRGPGCPRCSRAGGSRDAARGSARRPRRPARGRRRRRSPTRRRSPRRSAPAAPPSGRGGRSASRARASSRAVASPMPDDAPVTTATRPSAIAARPYPFRIAAMAGRFEGKQALVLGVANKRSIAWAIARAARGRGRAGRVHLPGRAHREERPRPRRDGVEPARHRVRRALGRRRRPRLLRGRRRVRRRARPARALGRVRGGRGSRRTVHRHAARALLDGDRHQRVLARRVRARGGAAHGRRGAAARS